MRFQVMTDDGTRDVHFLFGKPADLARLSRWRSPSLPVSDPRVRDALEFRKLAGKRWRYYFGGDEAATSPQQLKNKVRRNPTAEVAFILFARADWSRATPMLGCCFCRRTWCHHLVVDFCEKVLNLPHVTDHFFIHGETFAHCLRELRMRG